MQEHPHDFVAKNHVSKEGTILMKVHQSWINMYPIAYWIYILGQNDPPTSTTCRWSQYCIKYDIFFIISSTSYMGIGCKVWVFHLVTLSYPPCQHNKQEVSPVGRNVMLCTIACTAWSKYHHHTCKTKSHEPSCVQLDGTPLQKYVFIMLWSLAPPQSYMGRRERCPNSCTTSSIVG